MNLNNINKIFMIGIGGAGMRALALLLKSRGIEICGADRDYENLLNQEVMQDYEITAEDKAHDLLVDAELVIYSDAVVKEHPLRKLANEKNIPSLPYQEALGHLASLYKVIAVTGTHGKSSTTALLAHILIESGLDPNVLIGAAMPAWNNQNARVGESDYLVLEADEYREHFLTLNPLHAIITTIDFDHPDYYRDLEHVKNAYSRFISKIDKSGFLAVPSGFKETYSDIKWPENTISPDEATDLDEIKLALPGDHMKSNALLAITIAGKMGVNTGKAALSLNTFQGLARRFEILGEYKGLQVVSDYGHHPEEIGVTLKAAYERFPDNKIAVILEIHMPDRLVTFFDEFVEALKFADTVVFAPVFIPKGRENIDDNTDELLENLKKQLTEQGVNIKEMDSFDELESTLEELAADFDVALCFSAGVMDSKLRKIIFIDKY